LIKIEQLLPRCRQVLIGRKHGNQCSERKISLDNEISANCEKKERR
jgi:hypothetical protein